MVSHSWIGSCPGPSFFGNWTLYHSRIICSLKKEVVFENLKIDLVKKENNDVVVAEIKKSSKAKKSAQLQLAYYLYRLKEIGITARGELLFPKEKKREKVVLTKELESTLQAVLLDIEEISNREKPPELKKILYCRNCAYRDFCWC